MVKALQKGIIWNFRRFGWDRTWTQALWDETADRIRQNKGRLGDLGGGNHFLDALLPYGNDHLYFLIHTGSRQESGIVDGLVDAPARLDAEFERVVAWAESNRAEIQSNLEDIFGPLEVVLNLSHNTF